MLRINPVKLYGPNLEIKTYAMFDPSSTTTPIDTKITEQLNLERKNQPLCIFRIGRTRFLVSQKIRNNKTWIWAQQMHCWRRL